ncbi:MAG TPA: hypothetical protein EYP61_01285 [Candidatus Latescibacteria bacterium]|nr:hypothetical protein [Candidatus Latescibacterota bacterium]
MAYGPRRRRWVKEGEGPDRDWIWETYRSWWRGSYYGGDSYLQVWLNLASGVIPGRICELPEPLRWEEGE